MSDDNELRKVMNVNPDTEKRGFTQSKHTSDFPKSPLSKSDDEKK